MDTINLTVLAVIIIILFIILLVLIFSPSKSKKFENFIRLSNLLVSNNGEEEVKLVQTAQWMKGYLSQKSYMLKHYMRHKTFIDNSFELYCQSFYEAIQQHPFKMQTFLPEMIAFALHYNHLERNKNLEHILATVIENYPNPFYRDSQEDKQKEILSILYGKLAYHVIYYEYVKKHQLTTTLFYDQEMLENIYKYLEEPYVYLSIADLKDTTQSGYVLDDKYRENGIIKTGIPCGISEGCSLIEKLYFLMAYKRTKSLELLLKNTFERVATSVYRGYLQIRGGDEMNLLDYRFEILKALALCYERNKELHIDRDEFTKLLAMLTHKQKAFFSNKIVDMPKTIKYDIFYYYSSSEGIILIRNKLIFIELTCGSYPRPKNTTNINVLANDDIDDNIKTYTDPGYDRHNGVRGFGSITYATPLFLTNSIWKTAWLPGLSTTLTDTFKPIFFTVVPLDRDYKIFYIAYGTNDYRVDGYFDLNLNYHSMKVLFYKDLNRFIVLSLFDFNNLYESERGFLNDNILVESQLNNYTIYKRSYEDNMIYYSFIDIKKGTTGHINIAFDLTTYMTQTIQYKPIIKPILKFTEQFSSVTPATFKATEFVEVTYLNRVFIIHRNKTIPYLKEPIISIVYNNKVYPMIYEFLTYYAVIDERN